MATEAESSPALPPRSPSPTPSQCDGEYWDPPCKICKKVDNEDNVLCELCNGAYHLACIEGNYSKGLPRVPTDDEWFCKGCVKRGIPETIIDRVGRGSSAHYLVKWFGRDSSEVSWEDATTLDTAWSRKQIAAFVVAQEHAAAGLLLPPCHPLIDRKLEKKEEEESPAPPSAQKGGTPSTKAATPAPASAGAAAAASSPSASAASLADVVAKLAASGDGNAAGGVLAALGKEASRLLSLRAHPMYGALSDAPPSAADAPAVQAAKQQLARAAEAAGAAHDALRRALDEAERAEESRGRAALDAAEERLAIAPTGYMGYLHHLQEGRQRSQTKLQTVPSAARPYESLPLHTPHPLIPYSLPATTGARRLRALEGDRARRGERVGRPGGGRPPRRDAARVPALPPPGRRERAADAGEEGEEG